MSPSPPPSPAGAVLVLSGPAFAHVGVQPGEAAKGGYAVINFKVPNERDNASTTQLEVNFPIDQPLTSVMPQDVPGWTVNVEKSKLDKPLTVHGKQVNEAVTKVTWTGGKIEPGKFQQFPVSVGKLPDNADQMVFKAIQTYDNNEVVRWIEETKAGAPEPQNPAPVLKLTAAAASADHHDSKRHEDRRPQGPRGQPRRGRRERLGHDRTCPRHRRHRARPRWRRVRLRLASPRLLTDGPHEPCH